MAKIIPRFDFSSEVPSIGEGGFNQDGVLGIYGKGTAADFQNRLDAKRWNEYERVMAESALAIGDADFTETFPGLKLHNVSDAVRRLKAELNAALALIAGQDLESNLDTRLYGIETGWNSIGLNTLGTITGTAYTPGQTFTYEPSFEIIHTDTTSFKILGGRISLPNKVVTLIPSNEEDGSYQFDLPQTEFAQNVEFVFGPGTSLPAGPENRIEVVNGRFALPVNTLALDFLGKPLGTITYGLGAGVKQFEYINITGTSTQDVSIVLVAGTVADGFIDANLPISYYLGTDTFRSGDLEVIPPGYSVMVDPLSSSGKSSGVTDGVYYAYYMVPDTQGYFVSVNKFTGLLDVSEAQITVEGSVKPGADFFPLYFIKGDFNPVYSSIQNIVEESRLYTLRRINHPMEYSVNTTNTNDAIIDVRRFKSKPKPHIVPAWVPKGYLENSEIVRTDITGSEKKVLPLFIPLNLKHSKQRYTLEDIKSLTTPELEELVTLNHLYSIKFDYVFFPKEHREANHRKLGRYLTGSDGIYPKVAGFFGVVTYNGTDYTDLTQIDPDLKLEIEIVSQDDTKIWKGSSNDVSSIFSWTYDNDSRMTVTSLTEISVSIKINKELPYPALVKELQIVLTPGYSKINSTSAGSGYKHLYDYQIGAQNSQEGITISSDGTVVVSRGISPLENEVLNVEAYNAEDLVNTSVYNLDLGLTSRPQWWKVTTSIINQYLLFYDGVNIKLARICITDPRNYDITTLSFPMGGGESFGLNNPISGIYQGGLNLEVSIPERPKVYAVIKGSTYYKIMVASFYGNIDTTPEYEDLYTLNSVNPSTLACIGLFRRYHIDFENSQVPGNLDATDSLRIVFRDSSDVTVLEIPSMTYVNFFGYRSKEDPIVYKIPYSGYFTTSNIVAAYVENFRNSQEFPKDVELNEAYCTLSLWSHTDKSVVTLTAKRDLVETDPDLGTRIIFFHQFGTEALLTTPKFVRQSNGIEIGGITLTLTEQRNSYNPYTGDLIRSVDNLLYDRPTNYSIGTFLTLAETGRNSVSLNKDSGDVWSEDSNPSLVERYQDLNSLIASLINAKGYSYRLNMYNSENYGVARMVTTQDKFLSVANLRTLPRSAAFVSNLGVARRAGRFTLSDKSEAFMFQKLEGYENRPSRYGIVLFSADADSASEISGWPNYVPTANRELLSGTQDAEILLELGSASGAVLDSGVWNEKEKLESFDGEFLHKNLTGTDLYDLHTVKAALSYYPTNETDLTDREVVLPTDRKFIKYGNPSTNMNTPSGDQVYLYMDTSFDHGTVVDAITANPDATILQLGFPIDPGYLYRSKFYNTGLVFQTNDNAPASGILIIDIYDQYGLVSSAEKTFYRSRTILDGTGVEIITVDDIGTLDSSRKYTIKVSVKSGQSFSTVDTLKVNTSTAPEFAVRFIASPVQKTLPNSIWNENLQIKLGYEEIWTPAVKRLTHPWGLAFGFSEIDRNLPFITQSRTYGAIASIDSTSKSAWSNSISQWDEIKIPNSGGVVPVYYDEKSTGQKILITHDTTTFYVHNYYNGSWTKYTLSPTFTALSKAVASVAPEGDKVHIAVLDTDTDDNIQHIVISPWVNAAPGVSNYLAAQYAAGETVTLKVKTLPSEQVLIATMVHNGADYYIRGVVGEAGTYDEQVLNTVPDTKAMVTINQATFFGNTPYVVSSWKTSTTAYHISVKRCQNFTGGGSLSWEEDTISFLSGVSATVSDTEYCFAMFAKPGYLVYAPDPDDYYLVEGFPVSESMLDPYFTRLRRSEFVTEMVENPNGDAIWFGWTDGLSENVNVWSMHIPVPQRLGVSSNLITDPFGHNNWLFIDTQYSKVITTSPFWNQIRVKHGLRFADIVEDTLRSLSTNNSSYTDKILLILDVVSNSRINVINDIRSLARKAAAGMFNDWNVVNAGSDMSKPTTRTLSKGTERMRLTFAYVGSGPAVGKVDNIIYDYSTNSGLSYNNLATETYSYDSNGYLVSTIWS